MCSMHSMRGGRVHTRKFGRYPGCDTPRDPYPGPGVTSFVRNEGAAGGKSKTVLTAIVLDRLAGHFVRGKKF